MCDVDCRMLNLELEQWHDAGTLLATAVQRFCDLSVSLEIQCSTANWKLPDLVTRIDSLQSILDGQLVRARMALINIRNKLSGRSILHLPDEILSDIFMQYVYAPSEEYSMSPMSRRIEDIYQRVHTLLGVCAAWRRVGIACHDLWTMVPLADNFNTLRYRPLSTQLSLQRASHQNLHLAVSIHHFSLKRLEILTGHWHRFSAVNIWLDSLLGDNITDYFRMILIDSPPGSISKLSLKRKTHGYLLPPGQHNLSTGLKAQMNRLISSLSVFRISKVHIDWSPITFSHRLVELRVADTMLEDDFEIQSLFAALSSAPELKVLKLISIESYVSESGTIPLNVVSLPKLELLHLEHLYFNLLELTLSHIARGSYNLTLSLNKETSREDSDDDLEGNVGTDRLDVLLKSAPIDKLILSGDDDFSWTSSTGLRYVLQSVPDLKTLVLNNFVVNPELLKGLKSFSNSTTPTNKNTFPQLTRLEIHRASLPVSLADLKPGFEAVFESHQIQTMVFGGFLKSGPEVEDGELLDEKDEVLEWMRRRVPRFHLSHEPGAPEATDIWRLWDI
ncbi:unnamed protein product [Rhizoctonia solani]|uniref:F-box domain-containing protein n=1 Tax=Rhizoctonia solani TaxID=456999 RepID=A0A8H3I289_9AGAM|nr:unnamed protein product [Rhizoctonia solani]